MFKNYLTIALRCIRQNKIFTLINIIGFSIGIASCIFITLWIRDELSFDTFHTKAGRIYRILIQETTHIQPRTPHPLAQQMVLEFPEVERAVTMSPIWGPLLTRAEFSVRYKDFIFDEKGIFSVDTTFFEVFDFPFLAGDPKTALNEPMNMILTRGMALKYFGSVENAMGKTLRINNQVDFTINGVVENVPKNSHFTFDFLVSYVSMKQSDRQQNNGRLSPYYTWEDFGHYNYIVLREGADAKSVEKKLNDWMLKQKFIPLSEKVIQQVKDNSFRFLLQPMTDIHLRSNIIWELGTNGNILYVYIFFTAALLILIIACVNFMNLSIAHSMKRAREVGIRKTIGVQRWQLILQFLIESALLTIISAIIAFLLVETLMPAFNNFTGKELSIFTFLSLKPIILLATGILLISIIAGSYPAFFLSSFIPYEVLKGKLKTGSAPLAIRKALVIFQFVISIFLIICTFVIYKQLSYLRNCNLGFDKEQVVIVPMKDGDVRSKYEGIRSVLLSDGSILKVAASSNIPGGQFNRNFIRPDGSDEDKNVSETFVTADFFSLLDIKTAEGRVFSGDFSGDSTSGFVINEATARLYNWDTPVNKTITYYGDVLTNAHGTIIGVVKDFNIHSLHQRVDPLIIILGRKYLFTYVLIKIAPENIPATIKFIEKTWKQFDTQHTFTYSFLDEVFESQYRGEENMGNIFRIFAILAIFIAALGLLGLSNFMIEQRTKEIGIRKVHGAGVIAILWIFIRQFATWILIASVIAIPLGSYFAGNWLKNFAYRTSVGVVIFVFAIFIAIAITLFTISYQVLRTARMNPVESLQYE